MIGVVCQDEDFGLLRRDCVHKSSRTFWMLLKPKGFEFHEGAFYMMRALNDQSGYRRMGERKTIMITMTTIAILNKPHYKNETLQLDNAVREQEGTDSMVDLFSKRGPGYENTLRK